MDRQKTLIVFGEIDDETEYSEKIAEEFGCGIGYATEGKRRVKGDNAYKDNLSLAVKRRPAGKEIEHLVLFECARPSSPVIDHVEDVVVIGHHRKGDPGYGLPPEKFWEASSIGQLCKLLEYEDYEYDHEICAAYDHCPRAAYDGKCPDIDPFDLLDWRAEIQAGITGKDKEVILETIRLSIAKIRMETRKKVNGVPYVELASSLPQLKEASLLSGLPAKYKIYTNAKKAFFKGDIPSNAKVKEGVIGDYSGKIVHHYVAKWKNSKQTISLWYSFVNGYCGRWSA